MIQQKTRMRRDRQLVRLQLELLEPRSCPAIGLSVSPRLGILSSASDSVLVSEHPGQHLDFSGSLGKLAAGVVSLGSGVYQVYLAPGVNMADAVRILSCQPGVLNVEPNYRLQVAAQPNDPMFSLQWALANAARPGADVHAPDAWDIARDASRIVVAVVDTGVDYRHSDLAANIWHNPGEIPNNNLDDDGNGYIDDYWGYDFVNNDPDPQDDHGHGTHVAGIIGAVGNNGLGVTGLAWNIQLMPLKFLGSDGSGSVADAVRAIDYAVRMGARIINASWGGAGYSTILAQAIRRAENAGVLFVTAAGNNGSNNDLVPQYPASFTHPNIISVAATDNKDNLAAFSNFGANSVHIAAPGVSILSTLPHEQYAFWSGTSMAAPHVSAAAALVWSLHPDWNFRQVRERLLQTVDDLPALRNKILSAGRLNLARALASNQPSDLSGPRVLRVEWLRDTSSIYGFRVTFNETILSLSSTDVVVIRPNGSQVRINLVRRLSNNPPGSSFEIRFPRQTLPGTYTLQIGPRVADLAGNWMDQNQDGIAGQIPYDRYTEELVLQRTFAYRTGMLNAPIRDFSVVDTKLYIPDNIRISKLQVLVNIEHTWISDLVLSLISPAGKTVVLANRRGGAGQDYSNTVFSDDAPVPVSAGIAPFRGNYRPEQELSVFRHDNAVGTWTLRVRDLARGDTGRIVQWILYVEGQPLTPSSTRPSRVPRRMSHLHLPSTYQASHSQTALPASISQLDERSFPDLTIPVSNAQRQRVLVNPSADRRHDHDERTIISELLELVVPRANMLRDEPVIRLSDGDLANYNLIPKQERFRFTT